MSSFQERQKCLFNQLKDAEEQHSFSKTNKVTDTPNYGEVDRHTYRRIKREMKQFRGRESIYKRPDANIQECLKARKVPDHMKNPQKYKYYSLADVTPEQMSESTNRATALALMKKLEEQEAANNTMDCDSDDALFKKPIFQVSSTIKRVNINVTPDEKVIFKSSRVVMPEYVVGVTKKKEKKVIRRKSSDTSGTEKKCELKLNHLYDENDDEE